MAGLTPLSQDRILLFSLAASSVLAISIIRRMLISFQRSAVESPAENKPQYITQDVEDSLKLSTLDKLLDSPNFAIQETASIIVCERALHDGETVNVLLWYITRPEYEMREQGVRALNMMMNSSTIRALHTPSTYAALLKSLNYSRTDYPHHPYSADWDNWHLRDVLEQGNLLLLTQLVSKFGPSMLLSAGFIPLFLVHEPFGTEPGARQANFLLALNPQFRLNELLDTIYGHKEGRRQLIEAGLVAPDIAFSEVSVVVGGEERDGGRRRSAGDDSTDANADFDGMFVEGGSMRRHGQSYEEEHVRRRHREAMVLNDGTRPLGRGDIIQRER